MAKETKIKRPSFYNSAHKRRGLDYIFLFRFFLINGFCFSTFVLSDLTMKFNCKGLAIENGFICLLAFLECFWSSGIPFP